MGATMPRQRDSIDLSYERRSADGSIETWKIQARGPRGLRLAEKVTTRLERSGRSLPPGRLRLARADAKELPPWRESSGQ